MQRISDSHQRGKTCKINPQKASVKKKGILNQTLHEKFNIPFRSSLQSFNTIDFPSVSQHRQTNSLNSSLTMTLPRLVQESSGFDAIAQVQAVPLTASVVLKQFSNYLSKFEVSEIVNYKEIHFLGMKANKIRQVQSDSNYGFDDERSDYKLIINDHISYRYEIQQIIGKGSFGQVCMCFDHKNKENVAIKVIRNQSRFHKQARVELKVLNLLKDQVEENYSVTVLDNFCFRKHLCIVFELLGANLYELLKLNNFRGFSQPFIKKIALQLLCCLRNLKFNRIIHCDLKPENILLKRGQKSAIKVIDFGSSCFLNEKFHAYIQSRFYRAPEVILGINYNESIDMWSLGCIIAELHLGYPLFPGESEIEQLLCIMEVKGTPPDCVLEKALKRKVFFEGNIAKVSANKRGKRRYPGTKPLEHILKNGDGKFLDFLERCLDWDHESRIKPEEALQHPWLAD